MKFKFTLTIILTTLAAFAFAASGSKVKSKDAAVGTWNLRSKSCGIDGSLLDQAIAKFTRVDRMVYPGEILVISESGAIRKIDDNGEITSEGDYVISKKELLVNTKSGDPMPARMKVKKSFGEQLVIEYKNDPKCKGGVVTASYLKVRTYPHYHYEQNL